MCNTCNTLLHISRRQTVTPSCQCPHRPLLGGGKILCVPLRYARRGLQELQDTWDGNARNEPALGGVSDRKSWPALAAFQPYGPPRLEMQVLTGTWSKCMDTWTLLRGAKGETWARYRVRRGNLCGTYTAGAKVSASKQSNVVVKFLRFMRWPHWQVLSSRYLRALQVPWLVLG